MGKCKPKDCVYKKCFSIDDAICTLERKIKCLIKSGFQTGLSMGIIYKGDIIYNKGFGTRNDEGDPFTEETHAQLEGTTIMLLSLYFSLLAEEGRLCPDSRLVEIGYFLPHTHNETMTSQVTDLLSHNLGYNFLDTHLSYLLGHDPETVVDLLHCRIYDDNHNVHLKRNAYRKFHGKNLPLIQRFNEILKIKLGGGDIHDEILAFLNSLGIFNFGFGTAEYAAEANHSDGLLRNNDCWENIDNVQNVDNYESSMGAFANTLGLLDMIKLIVNNGNVNGMQLLSDLSLRKYFRESATRMNLWDVFCDPKKRDIPDFHVMGGGAYNLCQADANMSFYSGITDTGLRSAVGWDHDSDFGFVVLSRGKTAFPEALGFYASQLFNQRDPAEAERTFNWIYRLYNPWIQLHMTGHSCNIPTEDFHRYRRRCVGLPLAGKSFNGCEGQLTLEEGGDGCLHGKFGNIDKLIKMKKVALDNYCFELQDVSGLTHCGQIQFQPNADLSIIRANATVLNKQSVEYIEDTDDPSFPCDLNCTNLPPLEEKGHYRPCKHGCKPYHPCRHRPYGKRKGKACCRPCKKCHKYPCKCPGRIKHKSDSDSDDHHKKQKYDSNSDSSDNECYDDCYEDKCDYCHKCCCSPCCCPKPICYDLLEEPECFPCRRYRCGSCSDEEAE